MLEPERELSGMNKLCVGVFIAVFASYALAMNDEKPDLPAFADFSECKSHYEEIKTDQINRLNQKKVKMGAGMPNLVYSRKKRHIESDFDENLANCKAIASF